MIDLTNVSITDARAAICLAAQAVTRGDLDVLDGAGTVANYSLVVDPAQDHEDLLYLFGVAHHRDAVEGLRDADRG